MSLEFDDYAMSTAEALNMDMSWLDEATKTPQQEQPERHDEQPTPSVVAEPAHDAPELELEPDDADDERDDVVGEDESEHHNGPDDSDGFELTNNAEFEQPATTVDGDADPLARVTERAEQAERNDDRGGSSSGSSSTEGQSAPVPPPPAADENSADGGQSARSSRQPVTPVVDAAAQLADEVVIAGAALVKDTAMTIKQAVGKQPSKHHPDALRRQRIVTGSGATSTSEAVAPTVTGAQRAGETQPRSTTGGGSGGGNANVAPPRSAFGSLPNTALSLAGVDPSKNPQVRYLPKILIQAMRDQLSSTAVRELGVDHVEATAFSTSVSVPAMVVALLMAMFDVRLTVDDSTQLACDLFRLQNPLLGHVVQQLDALQAGYVEQTKAMELVNTQLKAVHDVSQVVEQLLAYSVADRTQNFLRGNQSVEDAPFTHRLALSVRDRAREATRRNTKLEIEREGRPLR